MVLASSHGLGTAYCSSSCSSFHSEDSVDADFVDVDFVDVGFVDAVEILGHLGLCLFVHQALIWA